MMQTRRAVIPAVVALSGCHGPPSRAPDATPVSKADGPDCVECIYQGSLKAGWQESGAAAHETAPDHSARVRFGASGDWTLRHAALTGRYGALVFRVWSPPGEGDFLVVHLEGEGGPAGPAVKLKPDHRAEIGDGWVQVLVPMAELDPKGAPFDRVVFRSFRAFEPWVMFDRIGLAAAGVLAAAAPGGPAVGAAAAGGSAAGAAAAGGSAAVVKTRVACDAPAVKISPYIYGIAYGDAEWPALGARARRWGGNPSTRYNWEGNFNNRGKDWFFENKGGPGPGWAEYLAESLAHGAPTALTVPTIGWVAKDGKSYPFSVAKHGPQQKTDPWNADIGNGVSPSGVNLVAGPPTDTSVPAPPEFIKRWVSAIVANDAKTGKRSVYEYILDNEPSLWHETHRDLRPEPLGYDELLDRMIKYGTAVREADRDAIIAGPAEWGWTNYTNSARDTFGGSKFKPNMDRLEHLNVPLVEWYLRKLREHEQKTGVRVLDVLDLHYYPQAANVYGASADRATQLLRLRATRSLWDDTYVDESWIKERVRLLPRMKEWVDKNYPERGISIGEWSFGGEGDITGALATAEALGRFAQFGVTSAFYWTAPPAKSESAVGFLAYRNFDGKGGHFLDLYVPTDKAEGVSFFASREADHLVVVAINLSPDAAATAQLDLASCGAVESQQAFTHVQGTSGLSPSAVDQQAGTVVERPLPPWSIVVFDIHLRHK